MFGLGNRKKYNGVVDTKLNNEYQIDTKDNPSFPGALAYLNLLDIAWNAKMSEDEGALYVATLYFCGIVKAGLHDEARPLLHRILSVAKFGLSKQTISENRWNKFSMAIQQANDDSNMSLE